MFSRKQKIMQSNNLITEKRYIKNKFLFEEESDLPELQVTPEGPGKSKIKFTWKSKGVTLPQDIRDSKLFNNPELGDEFEPLKKIYVDNEEAVKVVSDFINSKQSLFKSL
jgi:hypothetical protein